MPNGGVRVKPVVRLAAAALIVFHAPPARATTAGPASPIGTGSWCEGRPAISRNILVGGGERGNVDWGIHAKDLSTSAGFPVCAASGSQLAPSVSGSIAAWQWGDGNTCGCDPVTRANLPICTARNDRGTVSTSPPCPVGARVRCPLGRTRKG